MDYWNPHDETKKWFERMEEASARRGKPWRCPRPGEVVDWGLGPMRVVELRDDGVEVCGIAACHGVCPWPFMTHEHRVVKPPLAAWLRWDEARQCFVQRRDTDAAA